MDSAFLTCPICYEEFNLTNHLARMLPSCGHSVCCECLKNLLQDRNEQQKRCPLDMQPFPAGLNNIDGFKPNYIVSQILDTRPQKELCPDHNEKMNVICFTDQKRICCTCVIEGAHQNHNVKTMKALKLEANSQAKKIKGALNNLDTCYEKAKQTMNEKMTLLLNGVKGEFQAIKKRIADKEQDIVYQIHSYFYNQEQKLNNLVGKSSSTWKSLESDASELDNIIKNKEIFKNEELLQKVQDHLANCNTEIDSQALEEEDKTIKSKIEEILQSLKGFSTHQTQALSEFQLGFKKNIFRNLARGVLKDLAALDNNLHGQMETEEDPFMFKSSTALNFKYAQEELTISTTELSQEKVLDIEKWKKAKNVSLFIKHDIVAEDLEVLSFIWRTLQGNDTLYLDLNSNLISQEFLELLAQRELSYSKVTIWREKLDLTSENDATLLGRILSQCKNLEEIRLYLNDTKLGKLTLQNILRDIFTQGANIKTLVLNLNETNVDDDAICQLSLNLPQIKCLKLFLKSTKITNRLIEWLGKNSCNLISCLEVFELNLHNTSITDAFMDNLFSAFKNLKSLLMDLGDTKITNKTLEALSLVMPNFASIIEQLSLWLWKTNVTDEGIKSICMNLPNINMLELIVSNPKITDKAIELLSQNTLSSAIKLKSFNLDLSNTAVTDHSMRQVLETLSELNELEICLDSTGVTDNSIAPFIIDKIPAMKDLEKFMLSVKETKVSRTVQTKIQELEKSINPVE